MAKKSLTEHQILRDLARIQSLDFDPSEDDSYAEEEENEKDKNKPWRAPTREARDLILAEEIIRFASTVNRPCTSQTHRLPGEVETMPDSTSDTLSPDSEPFPLPKMAKNTIKKGVNGLEHFESDVGDKEITAAVGHTSTKAMPIAPEPGTSGSEPQRSARFRSSLPSASSLQDGYFPVGEAKIPIDPQPYTSSPESRHNAIPVTNNILAAIAQNELERAISSGSMIQPPNIETKDSSLKNSHHLISNTLESLKTLKESDLCRASSPDSLALASLSLTERSDELSALNHHLMLTTELEEMITKNMKRERDEPGVVGDYPLQNQQGEPNGENDEMYTNHHEGIPAAHALENPNENDFQNVGDSDINVNIVEAIHATDDNASGQSEFPEEGDLSGLEWTRPEKRRLGTVIRDLSREMKTKELQQNRARLLKKGRIIAQAIENKICNINKEITALNKKSLRHVALPLDQIQDYDWFKVATILNTKRSPEECRTYWKYFLHPAINGSEWSLVEVKAMEMIAQHHNFRNWDDIAEELNTGRSGYQCYTYYRKHLCPHSELRGTPKKK